jgi:hypothetical protein
MEEGLNIQTDLGSEAAAQIEQLRRKPTCDVEVAARLLGVSRGLAYQEARTGSLAGVPVIRVGRRMRVLVRPLLERLGYRDAADVAIPREDCNA